MAVANPDQVIPIVLYDRDIIQKCYVDKRVLQNHQAYLVKGKFQDLQGAIRTILMTSHTTMPIQTSHDCMAIYCLVGLEKTFQMFPCLDAMRVHELLSTLKEDGTCQLIDKDAEEIEVKIMALIVS